MKCLFLKRFRHAVPVFAGIFFTVVFSACSPALTIKATDANQAEISFSTGFSKEMEKTLRSLAGAFSEGADTDAPLFNANDVASLMHSAGMTSVKTTGTNNSTISTSGSVLTSAKNALTQTGMLSVTAHSLTFTLGASQFKALYALLDEEAQAYFDLLMIPSIAGEEMTSAEYTEELASLYGKPFAEEITNGTLSLTLSSPDGKKKTTAAITLGELLTLTGKKSWSVIW